MSTNLNKKLRFIIYKKATFSLPEIVRYKSGVLHIDQCLPIISLDRIVVLPRLNTELCW